MSPVMTPSAQEPNVLECDICGDDLIDGQGYACPDGYVCEDCAVKYPPEFGVT